MDFEFLSHLSKIKGCGGRIKNTYESFVVEEIFEGKRVTELELKNEERSEYLTFLLMKKGISTYEAINLISKWLNVSIDRFSVAGQKDKNAVTYQLVSCWKGKDITRERISKLNEKSNKIRILKIWDTNEKIYIGNLTGNFFTITLENVNNINAIKDIMEENNYLFPNYFGPQRFGVRSTNIKVAKSILLKDYKKAIEQLLEISDWEDIYNFDDLERFGEYEKKIINYIKNRKNDDNVYKNAIKIIPLPIIKIILESYQSYLFNLEVSIRIKRGMIEPLENERKCGLNEYGFIDPSVEGNISTCCQVVGFDSQPNEIMKDILWNEGIEIGDFKLREYPQIRLKGTWRPLFANVKDLNISKNNEEYILRFELTKGAYATSAIREIIDVNRI